MKLKGRLLRRQRADAMPTPVYIEYGRGMTPAEALAAAIASGKVPAKAWIVLLPQQAASHEEWQRDCQAEEAERQRRRAAERQQAIQTGTEPAEHS